MDMRRTFFRSILLAAIISGPLAVAGVFMQWASFDPRDFLRDVSPAMWSARAFIAYFDLSMMLSVVPCVLWTMRFTERLRVQLATAEPE